MSTAFEAFARLRGYCEAQEFKGWDPYDGLNSAVFQATPLKDWDLARLLLIQTLKRSPINLRPLLMVAKDHNPKGIGLLLNGYCNILRISRAGDDRFGPADDIEETIRGLSDLLISLITPGYSGACWGYNFGWQARRLFYFPAYTPTVVATAFCVSALINAAEVLGEKNF